MLHDLNECEIIVEVFSNHFCLIINNLGGAALHSYLSNQKVETVEIILNEYLITYNLKFIIDHVY